jgi:hypothetical protein
LRRRHARREAGLQQIAARRGFPVEHLAGHEHAPAAFQFQAVQRLERQAAGRRDRPVQRLDTGQRDRRGLDRRRQGRGLGRQVQAVGLAQQIDLDRRQMRGLAQEVGQGLAVARLGQPRRQDLDRKVRSQVDLDHRPAFGGDRLARRRAQGVDRPAFEPVAGDHRVAAGRHLAEAQADVLQRLAGEAVLEHRAPGDVEAAVGGDERRDARAPGFQQRSPGPVRA